MIKIYVSQIDHARIPGVYHMGYHSKESFGCCSYFICHKTVSTSGEKQTVNVMVDCPRYHSKLAETIEDEFGTIDFLVLTHKDDVAHHDKYVLLRTYSKK